MTRARTTSLGLMVVGLVLIGTVRPGAAATFTVTVTDDTTDGTCNAAHCSLREAIAAANAAAGVDTIAFNIPGAGVRRIQLASELPLITEAVTIDGYTQPGSSPNSNVTGGLNAVPLIEVRGGASVAVLLNMFRGSASPDVLTIRGLVLNGASGAALGINASGFGAVVIAGNFIGTDASGTSAVPNVEGMSISAGTATIGGSTPDARNLISGNRDNGIVSIVNATSVTLTVQGNLIGTNKTGTAALGNKTGYRQAGDGGARHTVTIGGATPAVRNVISGNVQIGVSYGNGGVGTGYTATGRIQGNFVGTDVTGSAPLGNGTEGVRIEAGPGMMLGGANPGEANVIAFNGGAGVVVGQGLGGGTGQERTSVLSNSIHSNGNMGIDLTGAPGVTPNDPGDVDALLQNFPVITGVSSAGGSTTITGTLDAEANKVYRLQFFRNSAVDATSHGEGETFIGEQTGVATTASGSATFSVTLPATVSPVQWVTATATDPDGNTSEFSRLEADLVVTHVDAPDPTSANQGVTHTLTVTNRASSVFPSGPVTLQYTLAGDATFVSATGGATPTGGVVTFNLGTVAIGSSITRTVVVRYASEGAKTSTAQVSSVVIDPVTSDNTAAATTTVVAARFSISGEVRDGLESGVAGATLTLSGSTAATTTTTADGRYVFAQLAAGGTYTVTPSKDDFVFTPPSQTFPNLQRDEVASFFIATVGKFTRYFAEGAVSEFFDTRIALLNATGTPATAKVTFLTADLQAFERSIPLAGIERVTIDPKQLGLTTGEFSTVIESDQPIIADRTMEWSDVPASSPGRAQGEYGSHAETSIAAPQAKWYLAEGATIGGFELFYLLQNATAADAQVTVQYLLPAPQAPVVKSYVVPGRSRFNIWVNKADARLDDAEVSAVITSTNGVPLIVERAMYLNTGGKVFRAGHESAAVEAPALEWFLAEGATGEFFDLFVLVANPNAEEATIEAKFLKPDGSVIPRTYAVAGQSRFNIWVDLEPGLANTAVSATIRSTNGVPIIVERAMWWPLDNTQWYEGHNSAGALRAGTKWGLADGELIGTGETYVLIANTSTFVAQAQVTLIFESGETATRTLTLAPTSRLNVDVRREFPGAIGQRFGVIVESLGGVPAQIVVERAMYKDANGVFWDAGSNVVGTRLR